MFSLLEKDTLKNRNFIDELSNIFRETNKRVAVYNKETGEFEFNGVFKGIDIEGNARYIQDGYKDKEIKEGLLKSIKLLE